ncbi:MAG: GspE/PulE family protein [Actinomycetota bacterium]
MAKARYVLDGERPRLGELLLEQDMVSPEALASALDLQQESGRKLGAILVESGVLDPHALSRAIARQYDLPVIDLRQVRPSDEAIALVPEQVARAHRLVPLRVVDGVLDAAVADPGDPTLREALANLPVSSVSLFVAPAADVDLALNTYYRLLHADDKAVQQFWASSTVQIIEDRTTLDGDAPVIQLVNRLLAQALRDRASDVHVEPTEGRTRIRFRVDGALHEVLSLPVNTGVELVSRIKVMAEMDIVERRRPQDGQFQTNVFGMEVDVRVATGATIWGEKAVLRLLDKTRSLKQMHELGMPADSFARYEKILHSPYGMILCSGPTGSGKTTTLYASLAEISRDEINVTTIEDPVEYIFPRVNQMQILPQAGVTFATGLKSILRQDPDVILVGEIRDGETARIAVQSALTGHLVMSSIHAIDAASALSRLTDMGIEPFLVATSLVGIVGQRLVRRICPSCVEDFKPPSGEIEYFRRLGGSRTKKVFRRGAGCEFCAHTGFRDRVGVYEVLEVTEEVAHLVNTGCTPQQIREVAAAQGMQSMAVEGMRLVEDGVTTIHEVVRHVHIA